MSRDITAIVDDIRYIDDTDKRLRQMHDRVAGKGAVIWEGQPHGPLRASDFETVRDRLLEELGEAYYEAIQQALTGRARIIEEGEE